MCRLRLFSRFSVCQEWLKTSGDLTPFGPRLLGLKWEFYMMSWPVLRSLDSSWESGYQCTPLGFGVWNTGLSFMICPVAVTHISQQRALHFSFHSSFCNLASTFSSKVSLTAFLKYNKSKWHSLFVVSCYISLIFGVMQLGLINVHF